MERDRDTQPDEPLEMGGLILQPGVNIGGYVFLREIGSGGMARVLLAKAPNGTLVALKVLRRSRFKTGLARFRREFRALSKTNHPNVIHVDAYGDLHGHPYIAMEYIDGPDLHALIRSFRAWEPEKRWRRCEEILVDLCRALAAIHRRGLVHRDLKPSNVLITKDGLCKLTDFGIVKDIDPSHEAQQSTTLVGTWAYCSPEQITGQPIDHRSDLYSLGVILFAMLTGKRPFVANDMAGYLALHRDRPAPAARDVNRVIPEHLDEICRRLLQKSPRDRYQSAQEILYRLEAEERVPVPSSADGWEPPLVGRDLELESISNAVAGLTGNRGGLLLLEGEDGSGKSRLLDVVVDRARNLGVPFSREEFAAEVPVFQVLLRILRDTARELGTRAPSDSERHLADFAAGGDLRGDQRHALADSALEIMSHALEDGPRMWILDDLHDAAPREIELLSHLLRCLVQKSAMPFLVVATLRPKANASADRLASGEDLGFEPKEIAVGPLAREDIAHILFGLVGETPAAALLAQRLHRETEGNAFFTSEFLRSLMAAKAIALQPGGQYVLALSLEEISTDHLEIPLGVRQMMRARLEAVLPGDRQVLEVLAIGGRDVEFDVLLEVLDLDEEVALASLDRLLASGIVRERLSGETILHAVSHRKFADVVYRDLDPERRAWLHRKVAAALELHYASNPAALEVVGEHYRQAGDAGKAYRYLVAAARRLAERSLSQEAWDLTEKAGTLEDSARGDLTVADFRQFRRDNLTVRAGVLYNRAEWAESERTWRAVLGMAEEDGDARGACEARLKLATVLRRRGAWEDSARYAEQALEASRRLHFREGVADALHNMAALAWAQGRLDDCERMANEGLLVAQGATLAHHRAELLLALTAAQATKGHLASATTGLTEAEAIFREQRMKRPRCLALANIAELFTWQGEPLQARQRAHVAVQLATELDYKLGKVAAQRAMGFAAIDLGLYEEAQASLLDANALASEIELAEEVLATLVGLTHLAVERGDSRAAVQHGALGLDTGRRNDPERYLPLLQVWLATAHARLGQTTVARGLASTAEAILPDIPIPRRSQVQLGLAWVFHELGEPDACRAMARVVVQVAGSRGFRLLTLEARSLLAAASTGAEQMTHRQAGRDVARDFVGGLAPEMARAFWRRPFLRFLDEEAAAPPPLE